MPKIFATRPPLKEEEDLLAAYLSTFRDGTGSERESDESTRAGWRQIERIFAELLKGSGGENKSIFDVTAMDDSDPKIHYGFSVKSKQLSTSLFDQLQNEGRVYMEIANSPAKFWAALNQKHKLTEQDFRERKHAHKFGTCIIETVELWHQYGKSQFEEQNPGCILDLDNSCYLCLSYSKEDTNPDLRKYQAHAFKLGYQSLEWQFRSKNCLSGVDPSLNEVVIDWYGLSGGQLKYYPKAKDSRFKTKVFTLQPKPNVLSIHDRAKLYYPNLVK